MKKKNTISVALAGNPNCGKTSLFNSLVGAHLKVGNFAGVTVEKTEGVLQYKGYRITFVDLPGTYSLAPYSPEELITRNYIIDERPDVVLNVLDGTNIERNLYLTTQLMELEVNMLIALNMYDEVQAQRIDIDIKQLQQLFGCHIVPTSAVKKKGLQDLLDHIIRMYDRKILVNKNKFSFAQEIETKVETLIRILSTDPYLVEKYSLRWLAIKLLESDQQVYEIIKARAVWLKVKGEVKSAVANPEEDLAVRISENRHAFIHGAVAETIRYPKVQKRTITDWIDAVLINRVLGLPIFLLIMWTMFQITFRLGETPMAWIENLFTWLAEIVTATLPAGVWRSLLVDGAIAGVGGVVGFLPNILLLFLCISFLEATGYMARAAFVVDKVMHKVGLHGKSFIPMLTGFGCSLPAFMACRTLKNKADRITTMLVIPFMSCGAKLPVYMLLIGAFFDSTIAGNVLFGIYMLGVLIALLSALILKKALFKGESEPFVMELPPYRLPALRHLLVQMWIKAAMYLKKAGTIILWASVIIWLFTSYPQAPQNMPPGKTAIEYSVAGQLGKVIEPLIKPLGFDWKIGVALVTGMAAKEIVVSTLGTIYALDEDQLADEEGTALKERLRRDPNFTLPTALALMVFVLLYVPCLMATTVFHQEAGAWRWTGIYFAYTMSVAWVVSFLVYHVSRLFF